MKKTCFCILLLSNVCTLFAKSSGGDKNTDPALKVQAKQWVAQQKILSFRENKGQIADVEGNLVPNVLFKVEATNINIWITTSGFTYQFLKIEKNEVEEKDKSEIKMGETEENAEIEIEEKDKKITCEWKRVDMILKNASIKKENIITEREITRGRQDYYLGHCPDGVFNVKTYSKITVKEIYPGIDWVIYTTSHLEMDGRSSGDFIGGLKHDFIVHPNADPNQIKLIYEGAGKLNINDNNIHFENEFGGVTESKLLCYQGKESNNIASHYTNKKTNKNITKGFSYELGFEIDKYDSNEVLVIDPQLVWSTFWGGSLNDLGMDVVTDPNSNDLYVAVNSISINCPVNFFGAAYYQGSLSGNTDISIIKFNATGNLLWATYYGGASNENYYLRYTGEWLAVDGLGNLYIAGNTQSSNFPTMNMAGAYNDLTYNGSWDAFILKFNSSGQRMWATFLGSSGGDLLSSIFVFNNELYVSGITNSVGFPTLNPGGAAYYDGVFGGGFNEDIIILKFNTIGALIWSTFYGNNGLDDYNIIRVDNTGDIYILGEMESGPFPMFNPGGSTYFQGIATGPEGFILKFASNLSRQWSTYIGGSGSDYFNVGGASFDSGNNLIVTGYTTSTDFPIVNLPGAYNQPIHGGGTFDGIIVKFNPTGTMIWSTYIGGNKTDEIYHSMIDDCDNLYVCGSTASPNFPVINSCSSYFDNSLSGTSDGFISKFSGNGFLNWSTYYGGNGDENLLQIWIDKNNDVYLTGVTSSSNFPIQTWGTAYVDNTFNGVNDAIILKFTPISITTTQGQINPAPCICNGTATINVTCGAGPYSYLWSNGSQTLATNSTTNTITGLCSGNYWVEIADAACGKDTIYYMLTGGSGALALSSTQNNVTCIASCNGTATITGTGGTTPYVYSWSNSQTTPTATGLCTGAYSIVVTDANGCKSIRNINIIKTPPMLVGVSTQWSCATSMASATVNVTNGNSPYNYLWSNGQTTQTATGLTLSNYSITVTDSKGCSQIQIASIPQPSSLALTVASTNTTCGNANGSTSVNVTGGTTPYTYSWSNSVTTPNNANIPSGTYTAVVTDANGCTQSATVNIASSTGPAATFTQSPNGTICIGTSVTFTNTGSIGTYNWVISPITPANVSGTTVNFSYTFLSTGTYSISHTVTSGGCSANSLSSITVINCTVGPTITATGSSVCPGSCGTVTANGAGGTSPYTYSWNNGATTQNINPCPVSTTTYTVTIRDTGGGTSTSTAVVTIHPAVTVTTAPANITCNGSADGSGTATGSGGSSPYTYSWSAPSGSASVVSGLTPGTYTVTVTDNKGCTSISTATIISPPALSGQFTKGTANCAGCGCKEWVMVAATGGTSPYNYSWPDGYDKRYLNHLCPGAYTINITDKNGCSINVSLTTP